MPEAGDISKYAVLRGEERGIEWCVAPARGSTVRYNGYARLPADHPWRQLRRQHIPVAVHGSLTYQDDSGWIGFDTSHLGDIWPGDEEDLSTSFSPPVYWTIERVEAEARSLARQIAMEQEGALSPDDEREELRLLRMARYYLVEYGEGSRAYGEASGLVTAFYAMHGGVWNAIAKAAKALLREQETCAHCGGTNLLPIEEGAYRHHFDRIFDIYLCRDCRWMKVAHEGEDDRWYRPEGGDNK